MDKLVVPDAPVEPVEPPLPVGPPIEPKTKWSKNKKTYQKEMKEYTKQKNEYDEKMEKYIKYLYTEMPNYRNLKKEYNESLQDKKYFQTLRKASKKPRSKSRIENNDLNNLNDIEYMREDKLRNKVGDIAFLQIKKKYGLDNDFIWNVSSD